MARARARPSFAIVPLLTSDPPKQSETIQTYSAGQVWDAHVFHYIVENGVTFLCMADEQSRRRIPFAFLEVCFALFCLVARYALHSFGFSRGMFCSVLLSLEVCFARFCLVSRYVLRCFAMSAGTNS